MPSKKQKNPRSEFLTALMRSIGGDSGTAVINAFHSGSVERLRHEMGGVVDKLVELMQKLQDAQKVNKSDDVVEFSAILKSGKGKV